MYNEELKAWLRENYPKYLKPPSVSRETCTYSKCSGQTLPTGGGYGDVVLVLPQTDSTREGNQPPPHHLSPVPEGQSESEEPGGAGSPDLSLPLAS